MPALAFRRRRYRRKPRKLKQFVWTARGPYEKTGSGISGYIGSGGDATQFIEAGAGIANMVGSGASLKVSMSLLLRNQNRVVVRSRRRR